jgi:hypothetical protein
MLITLTISAFAATGVVSAEFPPQCNPCPWVR